jgi:general secretion pathway protein F
MSTLEEVIALNDEVTLLAQAGIPLDPGMVRIGRNRKHELTRINAAVARRVGRGESLVDAVAAEDDSFPEVYQNIVEAGLRCGRLPALLEGLCDHSQSVVALKRRLAIALIYPILVAALAYGLFVASLLFFLPTLIETYDELAVPFGPALDACRGLRTTLPLWGPIPLLLLTLLIIAWIRSSWHPQIGWTGLLAPLTWLPWMRPVLQDVRSAGTARLTALLLEQGVPLPESLRLASGVAGNRGWQRAVEPATVGEAGSARVSPLLQWAITQPAGEAGSDERVESFRLAADVYEARAERSLRRLRQWVPVFALVFVGGVMTLLYVLSVFGPFLQLVRGLT